MASSPAIAIVGTGAVTPVGLGTLQTATSVRAGLSRFHEIEFTDAQGEPYRGAFLAEKDLEPLAPEVEELPRRSLAARLVRLAAPALREAAAGLARGAAPPALLLGVPGRDVLPQGGPEALLAALSRQAAVDVDARRSRVVLGGRAAGLLAIREACARVADQGVPVLAGGVDSFCDDERLGLLELDGRLLGPEALDGFLPGEGAGLVALARARDRSVEGEALAYVAGTAEGFEEGHLGAQAPMRGDGLAATLDALFAAVPERLLPCRAVLAGMNGESLLARQWGIAVVRNRDRFGDGASVDLPAEWFGDAGAALGPLSVVLAADGFARDRSGPPVLAWCAADEGHCAAAYVESAG